MSSSRTPTSASPADNAIPGDNTSRTTCAPSDANGGAGMGNPAWINVEVVYALPRQQWLISVQLPAGSTVAQAISASGITQHITAQDMGTQDMGGQGTAAQGNADVVISDACVGIFGEKTTLATPLKSGDRVEIYRPLVIDPKESRRLRARQQR